MQSNKHIPKFNNQFGTVKFLTECWWLFCKRIYNFWGTMCIKLQLKVTCILVWWIMSPTVKILFFLFCSIGMCRMQWFLAILRSFFHSSLLCTFSCHPSPQTTLHMLYKISLSCLYGKAVTKPNFYALFSHLLIQIKSSFPPLYSTKIPLYSTSIKQRNRKWMSEHVKMMNDVGGNSNITIPMSCAMFGSTCTEINTGLPYFNINKSL